MIENACFTENSFTMSLDIETNQWYDADGLDDIESYFEVTKKKNYKLMVFITSALNILKDCRRVPYKNHNCISMKDVENAAEEAWNPDVYEDRDFYECELVTCMSEICPVVGTEVNVAGIVLIQNKEWLGSMYTAQIIDYMKKFKYYNTVPKSLKEGYYAIDAKAFEVLLQKFYLYHKKDHSIGLIVAHNINYEWNQLLRLSETMKKWTEKGLLSDSPMSGNARNTIKSLDVMNCKLRDDKKNKFDRETVVSFRDTFLYCTTSLRKAGDKFGYEKGDLDYLRSFDLQKVADASKKLAVESKSLVQVEDDIECITDEEKLLQYNRRDCEIPILILHESFKHPEIILNPEVRDDGKVGKPFVPVSSNNINDMLNRARGRRRYEVVAKDENDVEIWKTRTGKVVAPGTKGAHKVYEYVTLDEPPTYTDKNGKERKQASLYKSFASDNFKWFGIQSDEPRTMNDFGNAIEVHYNEEDHKEIRQVSGGGMVGINPAYAFCKIKKVGNDVLVYDRDGSLKATFKNHVIIHEDLSSAHPSQVNKRLFPQTAPQRATDKDIVEIVKLMNQKQWQKIVQNPKDAFEVILPWKKNSGSNKYSGFGKFHLKNVRTKGFLTDNGLNFVPCIPFINYKSETSGDLTAKDICDTSLETWNKRHKLDDMIVLRNKVLREPDELDVTCTFEELCIYQMFADFEIASAENVFTYRMGICPAYVWDIFDFAGHRKVVYKEIKEYVKEHTVDEVLKLLDDYENDLDESDYLYLKSHPDDVDFAENALTRIKGIFNGIYGLMYQSPIHRQIEIGIGEFGLTEKNVHNDFSARTKRNYLLGMYIAQWSRVDLALHLRHAIDHGCKVLYWATDSIYMIAPDGYDGRGLFNEQTQRMQDQRPNNNHLGGMDYEEYNKNQNRHLIQGFCMTQSLRNLIWFENKYGVMKCKTTFSGANVQSLFPISDDQHTADDFDYCCERMLAENLCISPFKNNKNAKKIADDGTYNLFPQGVKLNDLNNIDYVLSKTVTKALQEGAF